MGHNAGAMTAVVVLRAVSVDRDAWAWMQYALSVAAATTGIVVFASWALERRRRPEARFLWRFSPDANPAYLAAWPPDHVPKVTAGSRSWWTWRSRTPATRQAATHSSTSWFPTASSCASAGSRRRSPWSPQNDTAGLPPDNRVLFFAPRPDPWTPVNWFLYQYRLRYTAAAASPTTGRLHPGRSHPPRAGRAGRGRPLVTSP
jgi:hypothetical protein